MKRFVVVGVAALAVVIACVVRSCERAASDVASAASAMSEVRDRFAVAGTDGETVSAVLRAIQDAVRAHEPERVAEFVEFPLRVNSDGGHRMVPDAATFVLEYPDVFPERIRAALMAQRVDELFANSHGVMVGDGEIWFAALCDPSAGALDCVNERFRVIAVNLP